MGSLNVMKSGFLFCKEGDGPKDGEGQPKPGHLSGGPLVHTMDEDEVAVPKVGSQTQGF